MRAFSPLSLKNSNLVYHIHTSNIYVLTSNPRVTGPAIAQVIVPVTIPVIHRNQPAIMQQASSFLGRVGMPPTAILLLNNRWDVIHSHQVGARHGNFDQLVQHYNIPLFPVHNSAKLHTQMIRKHKAKNAVARIDYMK